MYTIILGFCLLVLTIVLLITRERVCSKNTTGKENLFMGLIGAFSVLLCFVTVRTFHYVMIENAKKEAVLEYLKHPDKIVTYKYQQLVLSDSTVQYIPTDTIITFKQK